MYPVTAVQKSTWGGKTFCSKRAFSDEAIDTQTHFLNQMVSAPQAFVPLKPMGRTLPLNICWLRRINDGSVALATDKTTEHQ